MGTTHVFLTPIQLKLTAQPQASSVTWVDGKPALPEVGSVLLFIHLSMLCNLHTFGGFRGSGHSFDGESARCGRLQKLEKGANGRTISQQRTRIQQMQWKRALGR